MNVFQMHIMWYESEMVNETFDSILNALQYSKQDTKIVLCLNSQTYIEKPINGSASDMFGCFLSHPIFNHPFIEVIHKTDNEPFNNIADWRRDIKSADGLTYWGESDCLLPEDYFFIAENFDAMKYHGKYILTFASRKMWADGTWIPVEFAPLQHKSLEYVTNNQLEMQCSSYINQQTLDHNNSFEGNPKIIIIEPKKIDGSLVVSKGITDKLIPDDMHFIPDDTCASFSMQILGIPQYHVTNRVKGHNYNHPKKRINTSNTRKDAIYNKIAAESKLAMRVHLDKLLTQEKHRVIKRASI